MTSIEDARSQQTQTFTIELNDGPYEVSTDRLKPAYTPVEDNDEIQLPEPELLRQSQTSNDSSQDIDNNHEMQPTTSENISRFGRRVRMPRHLTDKYDLAPVFEADI